ncbi:hypothetical protein OAF65_09990 [Verrucomicrobiales bacterium]|nr:hypothetical protein [Verrucomicrobiales bacterium]
MSLLADDHKCPWEWLTGHWKAEDKYNKTEVIWKKVKGGDGITGAWKDSDGNISKEVVGWCPDLKVVTAFATGTNGSYWNVTFNEVSKERMKGKMRRRLPDGLVHEGEFVVERDGKDRSVSVFKGKNLKTGETEEFKGVFERVKKKKTKK